MGKQIEGFSKIFLTTQIEELANNVREMFKLIQL